MRSVRWLVLSWLVVGSAGCGAQRPSDPPPSSAAASGAPTAYGWTFAADLPESVNRRLDTEIVLERDDDADVEDFLRRIGDAVGIPVDIDGGVIAGAPLTMAVPKCRMRAGDALDWGMLHAMRSARYYAECFFANDRLMIVIALERP